MWTEYRREFVLDRFQAEYEPTADEMIQIVLCMMRIRENPRDSAIAIRATIAPEGWIADVPGTDPLVCIAYAVYDDVQAIDYLLMERPYEDE